MTVDEDVQFYDRQGRPITHEEARELLRQGRDRVARSSVVDTADPRRSYLVVTTWWGVETTDIGEYPQPMIFMTAVFDNDDKRLDEISTASEEDALQAHQAMVEEFSKEMVDPIVVDLLTPESDTN